MAELTAASLKSLLDSDKAFFAPEGSDLLADGFPPTGQITGLLTWPYGTVPNPDPAPRVPKPFTAADIMGVVSKNGRAKAVANPAIVGVQAAIQSQDRVGLANWAQLYVDGAIITPEEQAAIMAVLSATIDDPAWPARVPALSRLQITFGRSTITPDEINAALGRESSKP